jgi:hypothetical protein
VTSKSNKGISCCESSWFLPLVKGYRHLLEKCYYRRHTLCVVDIADSFPLFTLFGNAKGTKLRLPITIFANKMSRCTLEDRYTMHIHCNFCISGLYTEYFDANNWLLCSLFAIISYFYYVHYRLWECFYDWRKRITKRIGATLLGRLNKTMEIYGLCPPQVGKTLTL